LSDILSGKPAVVRTCHQMPSSSKGKADIATE
jgi:hypothetical protein